MRNILAKQTRYSSPAIFFHWAVFLLVALAYLAIEIRGPKGSDSRVFWMNVHLTAGTLVLVLSVLRVLWRAVSRVPPPIPQAALLRWLSKLAHVALYVFIIAQPLLGIMMINLGGKPVSLDWLGISFTLFGPDKGAAADDQGSARADRQCVLLRDRPARAGRALPSFHPARRRAAAHGALNATFRKHAAGGGAWLC